MSGANNPMTGKSVNDKIKEAIRATQNKPVYLYDFHFKEFIRVIPNQTQAYLEFKASPKTIIKYLRSGQIYKNKYLLSFTLLDSGED